MENNSTSTNRQTIACFLAALPRPLCVERFKSLLSNAGVIHEHLFEIAAVNKMQSVIADSLIKSDVSNDNHRMLFEEKADRMRRIYEEIKFLIKLISESDIEIIVLENAGMFLIPIGEMALYEFGDVDILVKESQFRILAELLIKAGYESSADYQAVKLQIGERLIVKKKGEQLRINIQSTLVAHEIVCPVQYKTNEDLFNQKITICQPGIGVLGNEDFLMQLCIHSKSHSLVRKPGIRLHTDIDWFIRNNAIDWNKINDYAVKYKMTKCCCFALSTPVVLFCTPVPQYILNKLYSGKLPETLWRLIVLPNVLYQGRIKNFIAAIVAIVIMEENVSGIIRIFFPDKKWLNIKYGNKLPLLKHFMRLAGFKRVK